MSIYFYDENFRYIGNRLLEENEEVPQNATLEIPIMNDGEESYLINGRWVINKIIQISLDETIQPVSELERIESLEQAISVLMGV